MKKKTTAAQKQVERRAKGFGDALFGKDPSLRSAALDYLDNTIWALCNRCVRDKDDIGFGKALFKIGQRISCMIEEEGRKDRPPAWLLERARLEYEIPWVMRGGKQAMGFERLPATLYLKRGKSRFDVAQTRVVSETVWFIDNIRRKFAGVTERKALEYARRIYGVRDGGGGDKFVLERARLPAFNQKTLGVWWPIVKLHLSGFDYGGMGLYPAVIGEQERNDIAFVIRNRGERATEARIRSEFLSRCKKALQYLAPPAD